MNRTPRQYADDIEALTALINESGITPVLFEAASQRDVREMKEFVKQLKKEHAELWELMEIFYMQYKEDGRPVVFCDEYEENEENEYYPVKFPQGINLQSFVMLLFLSDLRVSDTSLFANYEVLTLELSDAGLDKLAYFQSYHSIADLCDLVIFAHRKF